MATSVAYSSDPGHCSRPSFLVIGAQKAETSALYHYLGRHPHIVPALKKELCFFVPDALAGSPEHPDYHLLAGVMGGGFSDAECYERAVAWYHRQFHLPNASEDCLTFEATPEYLFMPEAVERIFRYRADMRLVVALRDPVERAFSAWNMFHNFEESWYRPLRDDRDFEQAIRDELAEMERGDPTVRTDYLRRGLYAQQLEHIFEWFPRDQLHIVDSHRLRTRTPEEVNRVVGFLGLPPFDGSEVWEPILVGKYTSEMSPGLRRFMRGFYRRHNARLFDLLNHTFDLAVAIRRGLRRSH